ncbi:transmembrane exosortase [bacterium BMS3Bbin12]|nr:transmembrane exosortase [bacterium BMS3Bbin12]GBE50959.1 transmembrane exosortase [bacterium BMS3Bbin13]HDJ86228.1 exosortase A [Chromatiales bacterium]
MVTQAAELVAEIPRDPWRPALIALGVSLAALLLLYAGTVRSMVDIWSRSGTFMHGFLIVPISLYLIWQRRATILRIRPVPSPWALAVVLAGALVWAVSARIDVLLGEQLALVLMVIAGVWGLLGTRVTRAMLFPLAYLFFAVPMGDGLIPPLRDFTARVSVFILQSVHIPVLLEGRYISIPPGTFEVAQACAGLRYLIASVVLGTVYAYLVYRSAWRRLLFIMFAIIVPIVANALRAAGIIALAYASDMRLATGIDHIIYGWIFFGLVMFLLFWAGQFMQERGAAQSGVSGPETVPVPATGGRRGVWYVAVVAVLLVGAAGAGPGALRWFEVRAAYAPEPAVLGAPPAHPPWRGPLRTRDDWRPVFPGAGGSFLRTYTRGPDTVYLYSAYYLRESQGSELIKWGNRLYDGRHWVRIGSRPREVSFGGGRKRVVETIIRSGDTDRLVWSWYRIGDRVTTRPMQAKLLEAWDDLRRGGGVVAVVAVAADYEVRPRDARRVLRGFLRDMRDVGPVAVSPPAGSIGSIRR